MPRKTRKTIRRQPPIAKKLLVLANELQRINVALIKLSLEVADKEHDSATLQSMLTKVQS